MQQLIEEALTRATGEAITITGASRTDAGVHALGQCAHFDTSSRIPPEKYPFVLNTMLPRDIRVQAGREVPDGFHARFMTCGKRYTYRILNSRHGSAIRRNTFAHVPVPLDVDAMRQALPTLLGTHDFAAYQASGGTAKTTIRTIRMAEMTVQGDEIILLVEGDAFLYNMVRIIAGTLIEIGLHRRSADAFTEAFRTLDRLSLDRAAARLGADESLLPGGSVSDARSRTLARGITIFTPQELLTHGKIIHDEHARPVRRVSGGKPDHRAPSREHRARELQQSSGCARAVSGC